MNKGKRSTFRLVNCTIEQLDDLNQTSAKIWNDVVALADDYRKTTGKWISKTKLQTLTKNKYPYHSQSVQAIVHRYVNSREAAKEARKVNKKIKYPYKVKEFQATRWVDKAFTINGNVLELSLGAKRKPIILEVHNLPTGDIKVVELIYDMGYRLSFLYDDLETPKTNTFTNSAAVDPGEIHAIASTCTNGNQILISTRELRSVKQYRNKAIKKLTKMQKRCKKGSKRYKKLQRAKDYINSRTKNQTTDMLHKTTDQYVKWCLDNMVSTVYFGDVDGVQRNTSSKKGKTKKTKTKKVNQKLSQWSFGKTREYLAYKLKAEGIQLKRVDESYSSQTCPSCGIRRKVKSRRYKCKCGYEAHRDLHGSSNILSKQLYGKFVVLSTNELTYRRPKK